MGTSDWSVRKLSKNYTNFDPLAQKKGNRHLNKGNHVTSEKLITNLSVYLSITFYMSYQANCPN